MSDDIHLLSLVELADAIAARHLSAVEVLTATIARAERLQPVLNCFISLQAEAALESAAAADAALARGEAPGPLHGVPLAHKDMFYRAGHVTTCGSRIRRDFVPDHDSTALSRLDRAGAIYLGGLNMAEFATGPTGHNEHWGDCRNPWNQAHISGGSSSGSGASVGGRVVYGALGSDTGGSVRLPSACCGVVGLKPTNGLVSRYGLMPLSHTLDTVGPLTRTVRDAARIVGVIAGHDPRDPTTSDRPVPGYEAALAEGAEGLRIGVPADYFYDLATDEVRALMERSLDVFRSAGAEIVEVSVPDIARINNLSNVVLSSEAAAIHEPWIAGRPDDYQEQVRNRYEPGLHVPAVKYIQALSARAGLLREFVDTALAGVDALHTPGIPFAIPTRDQTNVGGGERMAAMVAGLSWCTRAANYLGGPGLIVPCGFTGNGLPTAFQLMGRPFSESTLFRLGHAYQSATDWHTRAPSL
ncbi:MAG: amidase [Rhodospirillales bacterium]|nr:amidase [Rhodospirillales bacterium]